MQKKNSYNITNILIPPDKVMLTKAYKLVVDKDIRVSDLLNVIVKDQALVLEIFHAGNNALAIEHDSNASLSQRIQHIGFASLRRMLQDLKDRVTPLSNKLLKSINRYRAQAVQISEIASILAKYVDKDITEPVKIGGLFVNISYILVLLYLGIDYNELQESSSPMALKFELETIGGMNLEKIRSTYLRKYLPEDLIRILDPKVSFSLQEKELSLEREIIKCAKDLVTTYEEHKISPHTPLRDVLITSFIREYSLKDEDYKRILNEMINYLTWYVYGRA